MGKESGMEYSKKHEFLSALGASICFSKDLLETDAAYLQSTVFPTVGKNLKLILNGEGSEGQWIKDYLPSSASAKMVTYSGEGPPIPDSDLFCFEDWATTASAQSVKESVDTICDYIPTKDLEFYVEKFDFEDYKFALTKAADSGKYREVVLKVSHVSTLDDKVYTPGEIAVLKAKFDEIAAKVV